MKIVLLLLILMSSHGAFARTCEHLFQPHLKILGEGSEGVVYLNIETGEAKKIFDSRWSYDNAIMLYVLLKDTLEGAGFKVPELKRTDEDNLIFYRDYVEGKRLLDVIPTSELTLKEKKEWDRIHDKYNLLVDQAKAALKNKSNLTFVEEKYKGYVSVLDGEIIFAGKRYPLRLHETNILIRIDPKTNQPEFSIIDFM